MNNPVTGDPIPAVAIDRIGAVARQAGLTVVQTQVFRAPSESMAADGWELTEAELRVGAELAAGRADHVTVHDDPDQLIDDPSNRDPLAPAGLEADAAGTAANAVIARARTAVEVITAHRQQLQHRDTERARDEELSRWHTNDHATDRQVATNRKAGTELAGPGSSAGAAW
jgi:hypothetical protein